MRRENIVVLALGQRGSGKSAWLARHVVARAPRVLTLDGTGESADADMDAIVCVGLGPTVAALRACAPHPAWRIVAVLDEEAEAPELAAWLCPPVAPGRVPYSQQVGGLLLEVGEVDAIAGAGGSAPAVRALWKRGRHYRLSIAAATQRPHECARVISSQSDHIVAFRQHEPRDIAWLARTISPAAAEQVSTLPRYAYLHAEMRRGRVVVRDGNDAVLRVIAAGEGEP